MLTKILGNLSEDFGEYCHFNIPENVQEDSGKCSKKFRGMFKKISVNAFKAKFYVK